MLDRLTDDSNSPTTARLRYHAGALRDEIRSSDMLVEHKKEILGD